MNSKTIEFSAERWARVERLFEEAAMLEPTERQAYLQVECDDDQPLCDYILALLQTDADHEATIQRTIVDTVSQAFGDDNAQTDQMRGEMIGPYRVERLIGSGGMGMVYLAERDDEQFDQQVAIKLGRHRLIDPQTVLRLRHERQILANLDHPNIARLFDGGTADDGVPYLVMEYIDGVRIDTYCDVNRLSIAERLRLFQTICSAVHYAHQNLVIHRDIKASNILVTSDGIPKLLDFGIAKLVDSGGVATDGLTREGAVIMTPANATPEQILGKAVTTATDVYALGLLLYNLLTGVRPYDTDDLAPSEFARVVCHGDVIKPSLRLEREKSNLMHGEDADAQQAFEARASNRSAGVGRLQRQLRGDLDTIVLKALRKEPERRYRSANAFADDIALHFKSMPIVARSESWRYRASKFVRRHYAAVSSAIAVVAILFAFTVLLLIQNRNVVKQRDTALQASQFLEEIFKHSDPNEALGAKVTAEEILAKGASRIQDDLREQPEIQSALMGTIGRAYTNLGEFPLAIEMHEQALQLNLRTYGEGHRNVAAAQNDLGAALMWRAEHERAKKLFESSLTTNRRLFGSTSLQVAQNLSSLGLLYVQTGEFDKAKTVVEQTIDIHIQLGIPKAERLASAKAALARILQVNGDLDSAELLFRQAIDIIRNISPKHPSMAYNLQNLGVVQRAKGDFRAASETLEQAVQATRQSLGEKHHLVAATLIDQGVLLQATGDYENAERVMREALSLYVETRGADNPVVGFTMIRLGMLLHDKGELSAAEDILRDSLGIYREALENDNQHVASALTELGAVLNSAGKSAAGQEVLEQALEIRERELSTNNVLVVATRTEYADSLTRQGRFDEAEAILLESVDRLSNQRDRRQKRATEALQRLYAMKQNPSTDP